MMNWTPQVDDVVTFINGKLYRVVSVDGDDIHVRYQDSGYIYEGSLLLYLRSGMKLVERPDHKLTWETM